MRRDSENGCDQPASRIRQRCTRRTAIASALTASGIAAMSSFAQEPSEPTNPVATRAAVQRVVRPIANHEVQLQPIRADLERTIVMAIASDPRSEIIAVAGDDHAIRILSASKLKTLSTIPGHTDLIRTLEFDSTGSRLVSAGNDGQLILWDRDREFQVIQRMAGTPALSCVRFSPDGSELAAVGFKRDVYIIGRGGQGSRPKLSCDCSDLRAVAYRHDGKILAAAGRNGDLNLFDRASDELAGEFQIHSGRIYSLEFVPASPVVVSAGEDGMVTLFDTEAKRMIKRIRVTRGKLFSVCVLDREHLAVAGSDNVIRIVNATLGRVVEELLGHTGSIASLASDGQLLFSGGYDATLRRWELSGDKSDRDRIAERNELLGR